jgi:hypothetical protein
MLVATEFKLMKKTVLFVIFSAIISSSWAVDVVGQTVTAVTPDKLPKAMQLPTFPATVRSITAFRRLTASLSMKQVIEKYGLPDREIGKSIYIYVYNLTDGSQIHISTFDGQQVRSLVHVRSGQKPQDLIKASTTPLCRDFLARWQNKPKHLKFTGCQLVKGGQIDQVIYRYTIPGKNAAVTETFLRQQFRMGKLRFVCCGWESSGQQGSYQDQDGYYHRIEMSSEETVVKNWSQINKFHVRVVKYLTDP